MPTHIGLSDERAEQLRRIANSLNLTVPEAIARYINLSIREGIIRDEMPGFTIDAVNGRVVFDFEDLDDKRNQTLLALAAVTGGVEETLSPQGARTLAGELEMLSVNASHKPSVELLASHRVMRVGTGIRIFAIMGRKRVVSKDVARDLAALLRSAADKAENNN